MKFNDQQECFINMLNDDCLHLIFDQLPGIVKKLRLEQVCKRWQNILSTSWNDVDKLNITSRTTMQWGIPPRTLNQCLTPPGFVKMLRCCGENLRELDCSDSSSLSCAALENVGQYCPNLQKLTIKECAWPVLDKSNSIIACKGIYHIIVMGVSDDDFLSKLFNELDSLKRVGIHGDSIDSTIGRCIFHLSKGVQVIQLENVNINSQHFDEAIMSLQQLDSIEFNACRRLEAHTLEVISKVPGIGNLTICERQTPHRLFTVNALFHNFRHLRELDMSDESRGAIRNLVGQVFEKVSSVYMWENLVDDQVLITLAQNCKSLRSLDISGSLQVTDTGLSYLATNTRLDRLILNHTIQVTDGCLRRFNYIKILQCVGCKNVSDHGIVTLLLTAFQLNTLDISETSIGDATVQAAIDVVNARARRTPLRLGVAFTAPVRDNVRRYNAIRSPMLDIITHSLIGRV